MHWLVNLAALTRPAPLSRRSNQPWWHAPVLCQVSGQMRIRLATTSWITAVMHEAVLRNSTYVLRREPRCLAASTVPAAHPLTEQVTNRASVLRPWPIFGHPQPAAARRQRLQSGRSHDLEST